MRRIILNILAALVILISFTGCKKYLDEKPNQSALIASTTEELQSILDYYTVMNHEYPYGGEVSADDYYLTETDLASLASANDRNMYLWNKDFLYASGYNDWSRVYSSVYYANSVLENVAKVTRTSSNAAMLDDIKGQALFFRAFSYQSIAVVWADAYTEQTALSDLGVPLRLTSNFNEKSERGNLKAVYDQIILDLNQAVGLLPVNALQVTRPSKIAALGLLSRVYLYMHQYDQALEAANAYLLLNNKLLDYNNAAEVTPSSNSPLKPFNVEVTFNARMFFPSILSGTRAKIDSNLYLMYNANDLRKTVFFRSNNNNTYRFKGSYDPGQLFSGISTNEIYLTRAECYARKGSITSAMTDLNALLIKRYKTGLFTQLTASTNTDALNKILLERRKELLMRGIRWMDIKRLNAEGAAIALTRKYNNQVYVLPAGSPKFALAIPEDIIDLSKMPQNPR